jgi:O-antigen ligase
MQSPPNTHTQRGAPALASRISGPSQSPGTLGLACLLLASALALGGSARPEVASLEVLRPLAVVALGLALLNVRRGHIRHYRVPLAIASLCAALLALQLAPLPAGAASALHGRGLLADIDASTGLGSAWRPLSLWPPATQNALWALLVPLSLLATCIQLGAPDLSRLLLLALAAGASSAIIALLQTIGDPQGPLYFYDVTNFGSAVGLFANRNHQAALLACLIPLTFAAARLRKSNAGAPSLVGGRFDPRMVAAIVATAFLVPLILVTGSRTGLLMGAIALLSVAAVTNAGSKPWAPGGVWTSRKAKIALAALATAALVSLSIYLQRDLAIDRLMEAEAGEGMRARILPTMVDMITLHQPWGAGAGAFREVYEANEPTSLLMHFYMNQAHNDWLDVALTGGLPGLAIAAAAICAWLARAATVFKGEAPDDFQALRAAGLTVLLILALASLSDYPARTPALACLIALASVWAALPAQPRPAAPQYFDAQGA